MLMNRDLENPAEADTGAGANGRRLRLFALVYAVALLSLAVVISLVWAPSQSHRNSLDGRNPGQAIPAPSLQLPAPDLLRPLAPEEAVDQNRKRPFVDIKDSPARPFTIEVDEVNRLRAIDCLTQAIYYEAASEGVDGGRAVAQVVLNRMRHPVYPNSVCAVVYQGWERATGCQFSFTCDGSLARIPIPSLWARSRTLAQAALAGHVFAPAGHATHYHADYVLPYWADSLLKMAQIGRHIFYRLPGSLAKPAAFSQRYAGQEIVPPSYTGKAVIEEALTSVELGSGPLNDRMTEGPAAIEARPALSPNASLLADQAAGSLLADIGGGPTRTRSRSPTEPCSAENVVDQIVPMQANDNRAIKDARPC